MKINKKTAIRVGVADAFVRPAPALVGVAQKERADHPSGTRAPKRAGRMGDAARRTTLTHLRWQHRRRLDRPKSRARCPLAAFSPTPRRQHVAGPPGGAFVGVG